MANTRISSLPDGSPIVQSTDYIPIVRSGANYKAKLSIIGSTLLATDPNGSGSDNVVLNTVLSNINSSTRAITAGGTGATSANNAFNNLAPSQASNAGAILTTDGTNTSWTYTPSIATIQLNQSSGQILTNGVGIMSINTSLNTVSVVPTSAGAGTFCTGIGTNGIPTFGTVAFSSVTGQIANSQMTDNTIALSRLVNATSNTFLGRSGSSGSVLLMSTTTVKNTLGLATTSTNGHLVSYNNTTGSSSDSGILATSVVTMATGSQFAVPYILTNGTNTLQPSSLNINTVAHVSGNNTAGNLSSLSTTNDPTLVDSGFSTSDMGAKTLWLRLTTTQTSVANGTVINYQTVDRNTTGATYSAGVITLLANRYYEFESFNHLRWSSSTGDANTVQVNIITSTNLQDVFGGSRTTYLRVTEYPR